MNWSHGYNAEQGYTYGYYRELEPLWLDICTIFKGITPPSLLPNERLRYLELGCGQGLNLCLIAVCNPNIEFVGIDFNPQHITHARQLSKSANIPNVRFIEADFHELAKNWDASLGEFNYISAHGVISWISSEIFKSFLKCLHHASKSGSLVYLSYNSFPGWINALPLQHLLRLWQVREAIPNSKIFDIGHERLMKMIEKNIISVRALPNLKNRVENLPNLDRAYLIQEYLHDEWRPFWFDEIAHEMLKIKFSYVGTANTADWFIPQTLPLEWKEILESYSDPIIKETILDMIANQTFRRDIWIRGGVPLWAGIQKERLMSIKVTLLEKPVPKVEGENPYKFKTSIGEVSGNPDVYAPLYEVLSTGNKTLGELMNVPIKVNQDDNTRRRTLGDVLQAFGLMLNAGHVAILRNRDERVEKTAKALNRIIMESVIKGAPYRFLVASSIPWIISISDVDMMLCYLKLVNPKADPLQLASLFLDHLRGLGRGLMKDGQPLTDPNATRDRAKELAETFISKTLPNWQRLGII